MPEAPRSFHPEPAATAFTPEVLWRQDLGQVCLKAKLVHATLGSLEPLW